MHYRPDIDGLRAIAVLSVVIFHLGFEPFSGGYVGVDVFFVISGYLITSLITVKLQAGTFTLTDFYGRRIRRLFPPLIATVVATFTVAAFILFPLDFIPFSKSAVAALLSASNIVFFFDAGYWDTASELKPLLHTWSLGIEEQFYLLWPAVLLWAWLKGRQQRMTLVITAVFMVSYGLCVWWTPYDESATFYLLPFRMFEFALGALLIPLSQIVGLRRWLASKGAASASIAVGLLLVTSSVLLFDSETVFPGWVVILPLLGTACILLPASAGADIGSLGRLVLTNSASLWVGRISYSLYLVHWPLVSLYRYTDTGQKLDLYTQIVLAIATLLAAVVLHYGIEKRFYQRAGERVPDRIFRWSAPAILVLSMLLALIPLSSWLGGGWSWRQSEPLLTVEAVQTGMSRRFQYIKTACGLRNFNNRKYCDLDKPYQVLLFGDSHEPDAYNFVYSVYGSDADVNLIRFGSTNNCPDLKRDSGVYRSLSEVCNGRFERLFSPEVYSRFDLVIYSANRPFSENKLIHLEVLQDLKTLRPELPMALMGGYIAIRQPCWRLANLTHSFDTCKKQEHVYYFGADVADEDYYRDYISLFSGTIDRVGLLCPEQRLAACVVQTPEGIPMFYDKHHSTLEFSQYAGRLYEEVHPNYLKKLMKSQPEMEPFTDGN